MHINENFDFSNVGISLDERKSQSDGISNGLNVLDSKLPQWRF